MTLEAQDYSVTGTNGNAILCAGSSFVPLSVIQNQLVGMIQDQDVLSAVVCGDAPTAYLRDCPTA